MRRKNLKWGFAPLLLLCISLFGGWELTEEDSIIGHDNLYFPNYICSYFYEYGDSFIEIISFDHNLNVLAHDTIYDHGFYYECTSRDSCHVVVSIAVLSEDRDIIVVKYDKLLHEQWRTYISNGNADNHTYYITETWDNGFIIGGYTDREGINKNHFLCKIDSIGTIEWYRDYDMGGYDTVVDVIPTSDSCYISTGYRYAGTDSSSAVINKYDIEGNVTKHLILPNGSRGCIRIINFRENVHLLFNAFIPLIELRDEGDTLLIDTLDLPFQLEDIGYYDTDKFIATGHLFSDSLETDVYPTNTSLFLVQYPDSIIWQRRIEDYDVSGGFYKCITVDKENNNIMISGMGYNVLMLTDTLGNVTPPVHIEPGWNLLSYPYMDSLNFLEKYPFADLYSYYYFPPLATYLDYRFVQANNGFWLLSEIDTVLDLKTTVRPPSIPPTRMRPTVSIPWRTQTLYPGWNIIATPTIPTDCANLCETYPEIIPPLYKYVPSEGGYAIADSLFASYGYWVLCEDTVEVSLPK